MAQQIQFAKSRLLCARKYPGVALAIAVIEHDDAAFGQMRNRSLKTLHAMTSIDQDEIEALFIAIQKCAIRVRRFATDWNHSHVCIQSAAQPLDPGWIVLDRNHAGYALHEKHGGETGAEFEQHKIVLQTLFQQVDHRVGKERQRTALF